MPKKRIKPVVYLVEVDDTEDLQAQELDHDFTGHDPEDCLLCIEREKTAALLEALESVLASVPFASYRGDGELEECEARVRAAINKAKGEHHV